MLLRTIKGTAKSIILRNFCGLKEANHRITQIIKRPEDDAAGELI
jgi:hypothetical protein